MKVTKKKKINLKYDIARNNYVGLLFFALVLASLLYIIKNQTETFKEIEPTQKEILSTEVEITEINKHNKDISELIKYLNPGDMNTFKIYQSSYIYGETINSKDINEETMLYYAYKYLESTNDFSKHMKIITCNEAEKVNLNNNIYQCGGNKKPISYYNVNTLINKEILKKTIQKIFNRNISNFTNFYTSEDNLCYFIEDEYICISHPTTQSNTGVQKSFVKAYKYTNKITIIEKYKFIEEGIYYKGFNNNEVGEEYYISTFVKTNGNYYCDNTQVYKK